MKIERFFKKLRSVSALALTLLLTSLAVAAPDTKATPDPKKQKPLNAPMVEDDFSKPPFYTMGPSELELISDKQRSFYFKQFLKHFKKLKVQAPDGLPITMDRLEAAVEDMDSWNKFRLAVHSACKSPKESKTRNVCRQMLRDREKAIEMGQSGLTTDDENEEQAHDHEDDGRLTSRASPSSSPTAPSHSSEKK
jgi:hypothetical protein